MKKSRSTPKRPMTGPQVIDALGISQSTLNRYKAKGCPRTPGGPGRRDRYCPEEMASWMKSEGLDGTPGRPMSGESDALRAARTRKINAMADWWELQSEIKQGKWAVRAEVERALVQKVIVLRDGLLAIAPTMAEPLQHKPAHAIRTELNRRIGDLLDEYAKPLPLDDYPFNPAKTATS